MKRWNSLLGVLLLAVGAAGQGVVDTTAKSLRCARYVEEIVRGQDTAIGSGYFTIQK